MIQKVWGLCLGGFVFGILQLSAAQAALTPPRELFRIADSDPRWEEVVVAVDTDSVTTDIQNVRLYSGREQLYGRNVTRFAPGERFEKSFMTIVNESFYASRGGRLIVYLGRQSLPVDIVPAGPNWIAETGGKRLHKITAEIRRFLGVPVGVNDDVPIITDIMQQDYRDRLRESFR